MVDQATSGFADHSVIVLRLRKSTTRSAGEDEFPGHQRRNGDESGSDSSPFCCFSNGSTLLLIHSGGTAVSGVHPVERVPQVSFLTILSIVGAEGWAINRDSG